MPLLLSPQLLRPTPLAKEPTQLEGLRFYVFSASGQEGADGRDLFLLGLSLKNSLILGCYRATSSKFRYVIHVTFFDLYTDIIID